MNNISNQEIINPNLFFHLFNSVDNSDQLMKVCGSFYQDYRKGKKMYAITSLTSSSSLYQTLITVMAYLRQHKKLKIAVISNNMHNKYFHPFVADAEKKQVEFSTDYQLEIFHNQFDFIDFQQLIRMTNQVNSDRQNNNLLDQSLENYDVVFWELPDVESIYQSFELYFTILRKIEVVSVITAPVLSDLNKIDKIKRFYTSFGILFKGLIIDFTR